MAEDNDSTDKGSTGDDAQLETYRDLLERGILDDQHREIADKIFGQEDFTLLVLHIHLLIEKALNKRLAEKGVPRVLLLEKTVSSFIRSTTPTNSYTMGTPASRQCPTF